MKHIGNLYFHGNREEDKIALTFDDGPSIETERVLNLLKQYHTKATFFIWGQRIKGRERTIERIIAEGHEIGNHSYSHRNLGFMSKKKIKKELEMCDNVLGEREIKTYLVRFPKFRFGINALYVCKRLDKRIIFCDVSSGDWRKKGGGYAVHRVLRKTKGGSIIGLHDYLEGIGSNEEIIPILEEVLPELKEKYNFVTISELLDFNSF